jgi:hypothetical protein
MVEQAWTGADPIARLYAAAEGADPLKLITVQAGDLRALVAEHRSAIPSAGGLSETEERLARAEIKNACGPSSASEFPSSAGGVEELRDWALEKASTHHRLARENPHLRGEHIASSSAYRELADELARRAALGGGQ